MPGAPIRATITRLTSPDLRPLVHKRVDCALYPQMPGHKCQVVRPGLPRVEETTDVAIPTDAAPKDAAPTDSAKHRNRPADPAYRRGNPRCRPDQAAAAAAGERGARG